MIPVLVPIAYVCILLGALSTFSFLYRRRKVAQAAGLQPWFAAHPTRDIYFSLLHLEPAAPTTLLCAALLRRAAVDVERVVSLRQSRQALQGLLQRGQIGDDLWTQFVHGEKEMEMEVTDVVSEANGLKPDWGKVIFQSAAEIAQNGKSRQRAVRVKEQAASDRVWWDARRLRIANDFEKSL